MKIEEIQQAIADLSPGELARFNEWFKGYASNLAIENSDISIPPIEETLKRLKGSLKGKGGLKTLMEERRKESLL